MRRIALRRLFGLGGTTGGGDAVAPLPAQIWSRTYGLRLSVSRSAVRRGEVRIPRWWLAQYDFDRDICLPWWNRRWWWMAWWRVVAGPTFRLLERLGVWEVAEGGYYVEGHWRWPSKRRLTPARPPVIADADEW